MRRRSIVAGEDQAEAVAAEAPGAPAAARARSRNTAPAIALAALEAAADDLLLVLPSDHLVRDPAGFNHAVRLAAPFAREGWIVTFGMKAERPETGYGYVERGAALGEGVFEAERFVEKPDAGTAAGFVAGGAARLERRHLPDARRTYRRARAARAGDPRRRRAAVAAKREDGPRACATPRFAEAPARSIDYAVMEKAGKVAVAPVDIGWSDIGSFAALRDSAQQDADGNALAGDVLAIDVQGCLIRSDGPLVAALGVEDLVIVATEGAVLVAPRGESQRVKEIVEALKAKGRGEWT